MRPPVFNFVIKVWLPFVSIIDQHALFALVVLLNKVQVSCHLVGVCFLTLLRYPTKVDVPLVIPCQLAAN